nr:LysR substrate-binding domain-containing protein [Streptomyces lienomycini]
MPSLWPDPGTAPAPEEPAAFLVEHEPPAAEAALGRREVDIAVTHSYSLLPHPVPAGCEHTALFDEPVHLVLHPADAAGYRLAPGSQADLRRLADAPWLLPGPETACHEMTQRACGAAGFVPRAAAVAGDFAVLTALVARRAGVALIPRMALPAPGPNLSIHPLRVPVHRSIHALRRRFYWWMSAGHHGRRWEPMARGRVRQVSGGVQADLTELWQQHWPDCPPVGYKLRDPYRDLWVRFHSLPESKRYAEVESEYGVVLERYNTVLDELFAGGDIYVITPVWATEAEVPPSQPGDGYWQTLLVEDDPDPEFRTYCHLFAARRPWRYGCLDEPLRDIADDKVAGVLITDTQMRRIYHPYDGGADVFLATPGERDRTRDRHADWLSSHPSGL